MPVTTEKWVLKCVLVTQLHMPRLFICLKGMALRFFFFQVSVYVWVCMCAKIVSSVSGHGTDYVCACQQGKCQFSKNSPMYFRLTCVSVKLRVRLPVFLGPAGGCSCLMIPVCWSSLRACPFPSDCYVSQGTLSVPVHMPGISECAILWMS